MPAVFEKLGISFQYPENWKLDEEELRAGQCSVTVYSPQGGFWSVSLHPETADPARMAKAAVDAMRQEYEGLESAPASETVAGQELVGYDLNFFYLDLTNSATVRSLHVGQTTYTIFCQAEDREFDEIHRVFEAMTASLVRALMRETYAPG